MPLKSVETKFSPDSTGFRTTKFNEYCKEKHGTKKEHKWIKCHAITGNTTNIITDAMITEENANDSPQFIPLVNETAELGFIMNEVIGRQGIHLNRQLQRCARGRRNSIYTFQEQHNGQQLSSSTGNRARLWRKMFWYYQLNQEEFLEHYHNRSNVESTFYGSKERSSTTA